MAVCRSPVAGGARAEVEVLELHRLAADLAQYSAQGRAGLDLREAIAAVVTADGLVVATPVLAASPSAVLDSSFFAVVGDKVLSGMPVLPTLDSGSRRQPSGLAQVMRRHLTDVRVDPVPTVVVAGPADWQPRRSATRRGCVPASTEPPSNSPRRRARTGGDRPHLLRIRSRCSVINSCFEFEARPIAVKARTK